MIDDNENIIKVHWTRVTASGGNRSHAPIRAMLKDGGVSMAKHARLIGDTDYQDLNVIYDRSYVLNRIKNLCSDLGNLPESEWNSLFSEAYKELNALDLKSVGTTAPIQDLTAPIWENLNQ
jgi:hypothetical protein